MATGGEDGAKALHLSFSVTVLLNRAACGSARQELRTPQAARRQAFVSVNLDGQRVVRLDEICGAKEGVRIQRTAGRQFGAKRR